MVAADTNMDYDCYEQSTDIKYLSLTIIEHLVKKVQILVFAACLKLKYLLTKMPEFSRDYKLQMVHPNSQDNKPNARLNMQYALNKTM